MMQLEHFDDFTLASSCVRFISEIEAVCQHWMFDGTKNLLVKGTVLLDDSDNLSKVASETKFDWTVLSLCIIWMQSRDLDSVGIILFYNIVALVLLG
ncbi:hypothetical protein RYX36_019852 [Vicia faba]